MSNPKELSVTLKDFSGLNNGMGNELVMPNEGADLQDVRFDSRGNLLKGRGMTDMALTTWPTGAKVRAMKFNALYQKYYYILQVSTYSTFYEYSSGSWSLVGHTTGNNATIGAGDLTLVTDSNAPTSAAFQTDVQVGDYFKYDEDGDANWTLISAVPSDTTLTLAANYPAGAKAAKPYTVRKTLGVVNYNVFENPTLADYSYWTSSEESTSYIYKWDETNAIINVSAPANQPANPKTALSFKNRLWTSKGTTAWDIGATTDAMWKFNETADADLPQDSLGANHATDVTETTVTANGILNGARVGGLPYSAYVHSHWKMDEASGNVANAVTGANPLTEYGVGPLSDTGKFETARGPYAFNRYFKWPASGSSATVYDTQTFAVEFWIKTPNFSNLQDVIAKWSSGASQGWRITIINGTGTVQFLFNGVSQVSTSSLTVDTWHYVVCCNRATSGADEKRIYIDGVEAGKATGSSFTAVATDLWVGIRDNVLHQTNGLIDDLVYWSTVPGTWADFETIVEQRYNSGTGMRYT